MEATTISFLNGLWLGLLVGFLVGAAVAFVIEDIRTGNW